MKAIVIKFNSKKYKQDNKVNKVLIPLLRRSYTALFQNIENSNFHFMFKYLFMYAYVVQLYSSFSLTVS